MTRTTTRPRTPDRNRLLVRAAGALVVTLMSTGAGCPGGSGEDSTSGPIGGTDYSGTDYYDTSSSGDPSTTMPMTMSTTEPSTTNPTTNPTTTMSTTADPTEDPTADTTDDPTDTSDPACIEDGTYIGVRVTREDLYGHFPYLKLFYDPEAADELAEELFDITVGADGAITVDLQPRASGSGEGHAGLAGLTGTVDDACAVSIDTTAAFESDTGPFGDISVLMTGTTDAMSLTLQGGGIPSGPITYQLTLAPE